MLARTLARWIREAPEEWLLTRGVDGAGPALMHIQSGWQIDLSAGALGCRPLAPARGGDLRAVATAFRDARALWDVALQYRPAYTRDAASSKPPGKPRPYQAKRGRGPDREPQ